MVDQSLYKLKFINLIKFNWEEQGRAGFYIVRAFYISIEINLNLPCDLWLQPRLYYLEKFQASIINYNFSLRFSSLELT